MPAVQIDRFGATARCMVWACDEPVAELLAALPETWRGHLPPHPARLRETLGARRALLALDAEFALFELNRDATGKPALLGSSGCHISLSHSHGHAAALVSPHTCGVDLQLRVPKILHLRSKFERPDERSFISLQPDEIVALHILFGAKEALYKLWGARRIDWREHLLVYPFTLDREHGEGRGEIRYDGRIIHAKLYWCWVGDYCLVAAIESDQL